MSKNHAAIGGQWRGGSDRRLTRINGERRCYYFARLDKEPCEGDLERHHVRELNEHDKQTSKDVTVDACREHHRKMTDRNRQARQASGGGSVTARIAGGVRGGVTKPPAGGVKKSTGGGVDEDPAWWCRPLTIGGVTAPAWAVQVHACTLAASISWAVIIRSLAIPVPDYTTQLVVGWLLYFAVVAYLWATASTQRRERTEVQTIAVRAIGAEPAFVTTKRMRWGFTWHGLLADPRAGRVFFPGHEYMEDRPTRAKVEAVFRQALHAQVQWPVHAIRPYFDWKRVDVLPTSVAEDDSPVEDDADREMIRQVIEEDLRTTMKIREGRELVFKITGRDEVGAKTCVLKYPPGFPDTDTEARFTVQTRISAQLGDLRFTPVWDMRAQKKTLTLTRRPPMPAKAPFRFPKPGEQLNPMRIPLGIDYDGTEQCWNLKSRPHMIFAGATGSGKSYTLAEIVYQLLIRGWQLILIDGKGTSFAPFRKWPGVVAYGLGNDPEGMARCFELGREHSEFRYDQVINKGVDPESFPRLMVLVDELTEAQEVIGEWWEETRNKVGKDRDPSVHPSIRAWKSVPRKGREGQVHMLVATQQPNASKDTFGSTETKLNLPGRFFLGPTDRESALMMFGRSDVGRDVPDDENSKGLGTFSGPKNEPAIEVKTYLVPRPSPLGDIKPADKQFFDRMLPLVQAAQAKVEKVTMVSRTIDLTPDPRLVDFAGESGEFEPVPTALVKIDAFELADMVSDDVEVPIVWEGKEIRVVEVIGEDTVDVTYLINDHRECETLTGLSVDTLFELKKEGK